MSIFYSFLLVFGAIFAMIQAGKVVVQSLGAVARYFNLSEYVISFALIAFATSLPELFVGINSALLGVPELSFGDIMGTNIVNFSLILGSVAVVGKEIELKNYSHFKSNRFFQMAAVLAPLIFMLDGTLSRLDGGILILIFAWVLIRLLDIDDRILGRKVLRPHLKKFAHEKVSTTKNFFKQAFLLLFGVGVLLGSTLLLVRSVKSILNVLSIPGVLIGVLIIAVCTSLPDLIISLRSVWQEQDGMALGDVLGAATINSTFTLGVVSLISAITLSGYGVVLTGIIFTVASLSFIFYSLKSKHSLSRKEGASLLSLYVLFVITEISTYLF